ncbi:hypothetical protein BVY02_00030 [bacterium J17]|nr:hypothetical protein BVY02_00030 [bacterium J17]
MLAEALRSKRQDSFEDLNASELFCPKCKQSMPVNEKPLLILSDGELLDYQCQKCGTSLGTRKR